MLRWPWFVLFVFGSMLSGSAADAGADLKLIFLGDRGHHQPAQRANELIPVLAGRGINVQYTEDIDTALSPQALADVDGLILYANIDRIEKDQANALLKFVADGKGFIPLHCASYCFRNNDDVVALMGAQFQRHGTGVFRVMPTEPNVPHPIMDGYGGFESWDETYVHTKHNERNRTVLEYRQEGGQREPWTWVRNHGKGRVFYTAWGHDQRTWGNPGFQNLVERGVRWACGDDPSKAGPFADRGAFVVPKMTEPRTDVAAFEYEEVGPKIPNYTPSNRWGVQGDPITKMQKPLPANESVKHFVTPVGFEMQLFADETQLDSKPIAMNWDERGRLWVCETVDYPNDLQADNRGHDLIEIAEDTDGDGLADRITRFADGLSIPTAILPFQDGCIVQNGTETLYLADTDGDGRADVRHILLRGWALGDTHGGVSNFRLGLDNWIYAMQGYNNSTPEIDGEPQQSFRMGFWRFKVSVGSNSTLPKVTDLEFLRSTDNNTWGLGISEEGLVFGSTANRNPSCFMPIANRYYERVRGWSPSVLRTIADSFLFSPITEKVRQVDQHGGYTAGAGHALYTARTYPPTWWNRTAFVCGPTGKLVGTFVLTPDGAGFRSTSPTNLVASDDEWSAPIAADVGPDGNVWILDWYNFIVQHNPTPQGFENGPGNAYATDLRDKTHGRIYRLVYKGADANLSGPIDLAQAEAGELVAQLSHPSMIVRLNAQRLLVDRGNDDVVPKLVELVRDRSQDEVGLNVGAMHALWTLDGLGELEVAGSDALAATIQALSHPSAGVRRNAAQALPRGDEAVAALLAAEIHHDEDPQVRLAAILALADQDANVAAGQALAELAISTQHTNDRWINDAITSAAAMHAIPFLQTVATQGEANEATLKMVGIVAEHVARGKPDAATTLAVVTGLDNADSTLCQAVLAGLKRGWPKQHQLTLDAAADQSLLRLLEKLPKSARADFIWLGDIWASQALRKHLQEVVAALQLQLTDANQGSESRINVARQLLSFRPQDGEVMTTVLDQVTPQSEPDFAAAIVELLSSSTAPNVGVEIVDRVRTMSPSLQKVALRTLLARPQTTVALLDAVADGRIRLSGLTLDQKTALREHPDRDLRDQARKILALDGGLPDPDRQRVIEQLMPLTSKSGSVESGVAVYKKQCAKCHRHGEMGEEIGPNLTGMAVHPKEELLVHILDPSRSVEGNFRLYTVVLADGRILSGTLASETKTSIEVVDAEAKRHPIQRDDIDELVATPKSLMPEGFEKQISESELIDLLEFLTHRGRYTPIDLRKYATVVSTKGMFNNENSSVERLVFSDWSPKTHQGVPFLLVDPQGDQVANAIMLNGRYGRIPPTMPKSVVLPCNSAATSIHLLSGISGWGAQGAREDGSVSVIVRLHYADGTSEDHELRNGYHFADYIGRFDVPGSEFAFALRGQQLRYLAIHPRRADVIEAIELKKGPDATAPVVMAITVESVTVSP